MKIKIAFIAIGSTLFLSACGYIAPRKIPIVGLDQSGSKECPEGERVYYYRDADTAACLPDVMVSYTHCVTELTVASSKSNISNGTKIEVGEIMEKVKGINLSDEQKKELEKVFASEGVIGEARAKAIETCKDITMDVYKGKVAPDIKSAATFKARE